ncbi:MAG: glycosyltransferase family 9 protein [Candidatus Hydrogenedentes bacterium]|nr:glycosyltransferase family 9 protein [Candidatus Hydrogenedentota bacterium]
MKAYRSRREVRTLVIHTGGIGDFLLFCPCLKRLAEDGPVELAGLDRDRLNLAVVSGIARTAHLLDDFDFASVFNRTSAPFESFAGRFDRAIVWMKDDGTIQSAFEQAGVRDVLAFPGLPPGAGWNRHASDYYSECLGYESLPPLLLPIESGDQQHDVLIHPGSGAARKNWPIERFSNVDRAMQERGRNVEWICGPADERLTTPDRASVLKVPSIVTLARHLTGTRTYIGNDSGVTHLAAACGCGTVAIFGPTDPRVWAPRGENVAVVSGDGQWPDIDDVFRAIATIEKDAADLSEQNNSTIGR